MITREQELEGRHNEFVQDKIEFWRQKVLEGQQRISKAKESFNYSLEQKISWEYYLSPPATENQQLLIKLPVKDQLTYAYKYTAGRF